MRTWWASSAAARRATWTLPIQPECKAAASLCSAAARLSGSRQPARLRPMRTRPRNGTCRRLAATRRTLGPSSASSAMQRDGRCRWSMSRRRAPRHAGTARCRCLGRAGRARGPMVKGLWRCIRRRRDRGRCSAKSRRLLRPCRLSAGLEARALRRTGRPLAGSQRPRLPGPPQPRLEADSLAGVTLTAYRRSRPQRRRMLGVTSRSPNQAPATSSPAPCPPIQAPMPAGPSASRTSRSTSSPSSRCSHRQRATNAPARSVVSANACSVAAIAGARRRTKPSLRSQLRRETAAIRQ